jgi:hypothetical protein
MASIRKRTIPTELPLLVSEFVPTFVDRKTLIRLVRIQNLSCKTGMSVHLKVSEPHVSDFNQSNIYFQACHYAQAFLLLV